MAEIAWGSALALTLVASLIVAYWRRWLYIPSPS